MNNDMNCNNWFAPRVFLRFSIGGVVSAVIVFLIAVNETAKGDPGMIAMIIIAPVVVFIPGGLFGITVGSFYYVITKKISPTIMAKEISITLILPSIFIYIAIIYLKLYFNEIS